ncbi:glycoside hydrolase family 3 protein [Streptomyces violascens]|uniref:beta-N-acetylhexosaminidase n=1 Tax=Streptomyces violascens TaxID=67381 RepID=A0ABQ3QNJ5_9ACTN|nr:glycoside hydrolase family 3 protein [Streptomyces violascens]GGU35265.1 beta-N-acetylhexosaminidase [Streptomyces violascens]GHI38784.1 beta-N-acetylhexosaminidase [Streptomyces violascens]
MQHRTSRRSLLTTTAAVAAITALGPPSPAQASPGTAASDRRLRAIIARMSVEEKIGQLFVMRVYGHSATAPDQADIDANLRELGVRDAAELIAKYHVGGIIYFTWAHNTRDPHQIADLSNGIQAAGLAQRVPLPLLIATDQEHGAVCRVGKPATLFPGAMAMGAGGSTGDARTLGRISGAELAAIGIRQDYSPDADVNINPANPVIGVRSFGADPAAVARMVAAEVRGYQDSSVAATAKHFPGHGDTSVDSHTGIPVITHTREQWEQLDAPPFRAAIDAGIDAIMTAHIQFPALDPSNDPATLSHPILTGILREQLGFDGVVITDSLGMQGVRDKYGDDRVPVLALKAGVDQLLDPPKLDVAFNGLRAAVASGELPESRLDASILRILRLKDRRGLFTRPYVTARGVDRTVGTRAHLAAAASVAERTTTLLANPQGLLPLPRGQRLLIVGADPDSPSGTTGPPTTVLAGALSELGFHVRVLPTGTLPSQAQIAAAARAAAGQDAVIVGTYNAGAGGAQSRLVAALVATGVPVIHLALRNPYDIAHLAPGYAASLATYCWTDVELRAAARVLAGRVDPRGRLPVAVPRADDPTQDLYPIGHGLSY